MKNRIIVCLVAICWICELLPAVPVVAENYAITDWLVSSTAASVENKYLISNLTDERDDTVAMFTPAEQAVITFELDTPASITGIRIALSNFPGQRRPKDIKVNFADGRSVSLQAQDFPSGIQVIEELGFFEITDCVTIEFTSFYDKEYISAALGEITIYGDVPTQSVGGDTEGERVLQYAADMMITHSSPRNTDWTNAYTRLFDSVETTTSYVGSVKGGYYVFQFTYPTDITSFGLKSVLNGDWAVAKEVEFGIYNAGQGKYNKLKNPEPLFNDVRHPLANTVEWQTLDLSDDALYKNVTHLMVRFTDAYVSGSGASWGGWSEFEIKGIPHTNGKTTSEIITKQLVSNTHMMYELGWIYDLDEQEHPERIPTRIEACKMLLKAFGEYEKASAYQGTFNFADAVSVPCHSNMLSYIYAYKKFNIQGDMHQNFMPNEPIEAKAFYKMMLGALGYEYGVDFTWDTMEALLRKLGIGYMLYTTPFTVQDMCNTMYEGFRATVKDGNGQTMAEKLREEGLLTDEVWEMYADKRDKITEIDEHAKDVILPTEAMLEQKAEYTFALSEDPKVISSSSFTYNAPFHYAGIYYGMLPRDNPLSKRDEFAEVLQKIGARALRFPGGLPAHQYLIEGKSYTEQLDRDKEAFQPGADNGLYDADDYNNAWYVEFYDYLDFCKENNITPIFQINPSFYVDEEAGRVRQAYLGRMTKFSSEGEVLGTMPGYYDHNRIEEAAEQLGRNIDRMLERGYTIKYWEFGNEDEFPTYYGKSAKDVTNPYAQDSVKAIAAYARVIKSKIPDAYFIVPGLPVKELLSEEDYALLDSRTSHYPFARWPAPSERLLRSNPYELIIRNDLNYPIAYSKEMHKQDLEAGNLLRDTTETMWCRFDEWEPSQIQHTFAAAVSLVHNWGELVFDSGFSDVAVMHDLESPWFGFVPYDVKWSTADARILTFIRNNMSVHEDDIPDNYRFKDRYYFNPASKAFELLGRHVGDQVLEADNVMIGQYVSAFLSVNGDTINVTIANRLNEQRPVKIKLPGFAVEQQEVAATVMQSDWLGAVLEEEYQYLEDVPISVCGNQTNKEEWALDITVEPYSVTHFSIHAVKIN